MLRNTKNKLNPIHTSSCHFIHTQHAYKSTIVIKILTFACDKTLHET